MRTHLRLLLTAAAAAGLVPGSGRADSLKVFPPQVELRGQGDRQGFVVQLVDQQGLTRDVTRQVQLKLADPALADLTGTTLTPKKDGQTKLLVEHAALRAELPVSVKGAGQSRPVSFRLDVEPVFMKYGCNNGSCHGAARGKDGFHLSLFGYDPAGDYYRLTRQLIGRRVDVAVPEKSLMLEKTTGAVAHTGGKLFGPGDEDYRTLLRWVQAGAPDDSGETPVPEGIELLPAKVVFAGSKATQRTVVRARYSDGSVRDVTRLALFLSNNDAVASIDKDGVVKAGDRNGGAFVFARFGKFTVGAEVIVLPTGDNFRWPQVAEHNYIDTLVFDKLRKLHLAPSELCSDETFLRRAYLDLIGLPPSRAEYDRFGADRSPDKRSRLIDALLERDEFVDLWTMKWGEMLRIRAVNNQPQYGRDAKAMWAYSMWVHDQIAANRPLNELVSDLLVGAGSNIKSPTSNLYTAAERLTPLKTAEDIAQVFLGTRIQCAQCHNHPFDRWTQDDYYGFAAFFAQIGRKGTDDPRETVVFNRGGGEVTHPVSRQVMKPKFLGGAAPDVAGKDRREVLAKWLASPDNPYFATNLANIVWAHFFGVGIIHDVDDVRVSNPAANPELLQELGKRFTEYKYDFKKLVRDICTSRTYQLATQPNESNKGDTRNFARGAIRRIKAETFLDCLSQVTETKNKFPGLPLGARAVQIADGRVSTYFLTTFGRATRETVCSCEVRLEPTLSQSLHLLNGDSTTQKIQGGNLVGRRLAEKKSPPEIIEELYVRCLSRKPQPQELARLNAILANEPDQKKALEDIFWAILNTREFMFNH